jgi:hypothetical protein
MTRVVIVGEIYNADLSVGGGPANPGFGPGHPGNALPGQPIDPGWGGGWGSAPRPDQGLPWGPGHVGGGPVYPGHPSQGLPWGPGHPSTGPIYPGGHPDQGLPGAPVYPSQGLPEGVEVWPTPPAPGTKPVDPSAGTSVENPIVLPAPPEDAVVVVWVPGVGYRYATVTPAEPK